jgi:hypothetical protein
LLGKSDYVGIVDPLVPVVGVFLSAWRQFRFRYLLLEIKGIVDITEEARWFDGFLTV